MKGLSLVEQKKAGIYLETAGGGGGGGGGRESRARLSPGAAELQ